MHNLSQTGMTVSSSPGAHGTPGALAGLGVDLGSSTPGQTLSNLLAGGAAMRPTMSDLGLGSRGGKRNEDDERREKMRRVLRRIGTRKGRESQDAIARVGRRVGLDVDADLDSAEERAKTMGNRALAIAGCIVLVEVSVKQHVPQKAEVMLSDPEEMGLEEFAEPAGKVLMKDLEVPEGILLNSNLDRFARNLNRLARLDILSRTGKVNCFRAIFGLYKSLKKLHEVEKEAVKAQGGDGVNAEDEVLRKRSGRPTLHANERIGLSMEYWTLAKASKKDESAMDVDGETSKTPKKSEADVYRLQIEAESSPAPMHAALRISDAWLPETFEVPTPESGESIPWQDPPPTYVNEATADGQTNVMAIDGSQRVPDVRFVAKLDPPVVLPWNMVNILSEVGLELPPIGQVGDYYDALLNMDTHSLVARHEPIEAEQSVLAMRDGQEVDVTHHYILDISKPDHGYKLEKLYFSHPRQLVSLLPVLRQWAQVGALLNSALAGRKESLGKPPTINGNPHTNGHTNNDTMDIDSSPNNNHEILPISIGLSALPQSTLSVTFPQSTSMDTNTTIFQILPNASLAVTDYEGISEEDSQSEKAKNLAKALEVCGDLGVWVEWMRGREKQKG